jgi:hypothetical protein
VLIKGSVIDIAEGTKQNVQAARFPKGVPAVSDQSMSEWMEYVYMQKPCPENAEGVEVIITTYDPNGNTYELGRTTTSLSGVFGIEVQPPVPGLYKIIATFEGSESYYGSYAETYLSVEESASPGKQMETELVESTPTEPEPAISESTIPAEAPSISTEFAIIAAVAIAVVIGVVAYWALRKRK